MASSSPQPESPLLLYHDIPAPAGWQRKVFQRKGQALVKKINVVYIAPDGEEIKSKTHLQRYLKAHPGGPALSDFNWSTGETPTRRSGRSGTKGADNVETDVTPERVKRSSTEISDEVAFEDQSVSTPSSHSKRDCKGISKEKNSAIAEDLVTPIVQEEIMEDVKNDNIVEGEEHLLEDDIQLDEKQEEKPAEKDGGDIVEEKTVITEVEEVFLGVVQTEVKVEVITEEVENVVLGVDQTDVEVEEAGLQPSKPDAEVNMNDPSLLEDVHAQTIESVIDKLQTGQESLDREAKYGELVQPLSSSIDVYSDIKDKLEVEEPSEQERKNGTSEIDDGAKKEEEHKIADEAPDYSSFVDVTDEKDKDTSQGGLHHCSEPVGVSN